MGKGLAKAGQVLKSLSPGAPGTKQWPERYGDRLVRVRIGEMQSGEYVRRRVAQPAEQDR